MNQKLTRPFLLPAIIFISILCIARFNDPPNGNTGAPGEGICTSCHSPGNPNGYTGNISISGLPSQTMAGQDYTLTVTVSNPDQTAVRGGFQIVALDENDQNAGNLFNPGPSSRITNSGGRTYHEHNPGRNFGGSPDISWTVTWTAPMVQGNETVTFYAAGVIANGGNGSLRDLTVSSQTNTTVEGTVPPLSVIITAQNDPDCFGESTGSATAEASGGTPPYDYIWSTGGASATETNMPAGTHSVMVFDQNGGNTQTTVTLSDPPQLNSDIAVVNEITCPGGNEGILSANATGGTPPLTFIWSNGQGGNSIDNLSEGIYTVTVEDINGCQDISSISLTDPQPISFSTSTTNVSCYGLNDGIGEIFDVSGGNPGTYNFEWSDGFSNSGLSSIRNDLPSDLYTITITDSKNCSSQVNMEIGSPDSLVIESSLTNVRCFNDENGSISLTISGGTPNYTANWSDGESGFSRSMLSPGNYNVTVTDINDCSAQGMYTIAEPDSLVIEIDTIINSECGDSTGSISLEITGGNTPFSYSWSNDDSLQTADSLLPGQYIVTVTDTLGCVASDTFDIIIEDVSGPTVIVEPATIYLDSSGQYIVSSADLDYSVTDNCSDSLEISFNLPTVTCENIGDTLSGEILARDDNNNETLVQFPIIILDTIPPVIIESPLDTQIVICEANYWYDPFISSQDNCGSVIYSQMQGPSIPDSLTAGTYEFEIIVSDSSDNVISINWTVELRSSNISGQTTTENPSCFGQANGIATFIPDDPGIIRSIQLQPDVPTDSLSAGQYEWLIEDTFGCQAIIEFEIAEPEEITVIDTSITPASSGSSEDGEINVAIAGGTPPYSFSWFSGSPGSGINIPGDSNVISNLSAGPYFLVVTDSLLCLDTFFFNVGVNTHVTQNPKGHAISFYPNPTNGILNIKADNKPSNIIVFTVGGQMIDGVNRWNGSFIDLSGLKSGIYIIVAQWEDGYQKVSRIQLSSR